MKAVAFDLDGCLIDSRDAILTSVRFALVEAGLPVPPDDELLWVIGPPIGLGFAELLRRLGGDPARSGELTGSYRADYRTSMLERTTVIPGIPEALEEVGDARPLCVVTSKPEPLATPLLDHLGLLDRFEFVEGPTLSAPAEPKAETLARALAHTGIAAMVGDRHHDVDAGRAHGLLTIGVTWGIGDAAELGEAGADHIVTDPAELAAVLR